MGRMHGTLAKAGKVKTMMIQKDRERECVD